MKILVTTPNGRIGSEIRAVRYVSLTDEQFRQALAAFVQPPHVERLGALYAEVRSGVTSVVHDTVPRMSGRPARAFRQFAADYKAAWA